MSDKEMWEELRRVVNEMEIERLGRKRYFPKVKLLLNEGDRTGYYGRLSRNIYIGYMDGKINPNTLLHEFIHYLINIFTKTKQNKFHRLFHFIAFKEWIKKQESKEDLKSIKRFCKSYRASLKLSK